MLLQKEIKKLRKYSYDSYVEMNLKGLKTNPKKYHQCLKNILQWNIDLGQQNGIGNNSDADPS